MMVRSQETLAEGVDFDLFALSTPYIIHDLGKLRRNLQILKEVEGKSGAKILLAQKGFATWGLYPIVREYLSGVTSSSCDEARLGREEFQKEVHVYAPAYGQEDIDELMTGDDGEPLVDHLVFNSVAQFRRYASQVKAAGIEVGLRVNPEHREVETELYDPCAPGSRLGVTSASLGSNPLTSDELQLLDGVHFHTLCQKNSDALERTLRAVETRFGDLINSATWVNFGGGHHITREDYEVERLVRLISEFRERSRREVYLEPGEAVALNVGYLVAEVLDVVDGNPLPTAILDTSATAHMPDVLEMPYRPEILGGGTVEEKPHPYRLGGLTCLAGDVIGDWAFDEPLEPGDRLVFTDMAHYTNVKGTTFNGVRSPSLATFDPDRRHTKLIRRFGYADYKSRLG